MAETDRAWLKEYFGDLILTAEGERKTEEVLLRKNKIGIYFSAHWCPPCKGFTPLLSKFYLNLRKDDEDYFEIIFASSDNSEEEFMEYFASMPWIALPYNSPKIIELSRKFEVQGIPTLVLLKGDDASVIDAEGRATVVTYQGDPGRAARKWDNQA